MRDGFVLKLRTLYIRSKYIINCFLPCVVHWCMVQSETDLVEVEVRDLIARVEELQYSD